ncbi:MAG: fibronectin type III domain-containing protein [Solirubrobacteraceae bacterium]
MARREVGLEALKEVVMFRNPVLVALAFAFAIALPASAGQAASPTAPSVSSGGVANVTFSSATLDGSVDPRGQETNYVFQYGPTHSYGSQTPLSPAGNGTKTLKVSQSVSGLQPLTTYHYRIVASSPAGTTKGQDRTFTTPGIPLSVAITGVPNPVVFGNSFLVEGTLSGTGAGNHEIVLQANPYPYLGGFKIVGNPEVTNPTGGFSFPFLGLLENAQLRVVTVGKPEVSSPVVLENVAVRVSFHAHSVGRPGFVRLYGTVAPAEVGALVGFQLLVPGHRSVNEGGTAVKAGTPTVSSFSRVVRVHRRGLYRALIQVPAGAHVSNYSTPILVR